ncbi:MAG: SGNH/GDSL hydrolase family protein [Dehalococcoidia bacterium]
MQILVLGDSDSAGMLTGGASWPQILERDLSDELGSPVSVRSVGFSAMPENAFEFAEKKVREASPDVTVVVLGSFGFTAGFVWLRVQKLFGKRAGRWYRRWEERFDGATRDDGGRPGRVNVSGRWLVRHLIGTGTYSTREKITENYLKVFRVLSRFEDMQFVIFAYPGIGEHARQGKGPALRKKFFGDLRAVAEDYHFRWVDGAAAFAGMDFAELRLDDLHFNPRGHAILANAVKDAVLAAVPA